MHKSHRGSWIVDRGVHRPRAHLTRGVLKLRHTIMKRRIMIHNHILTQNDNETIKKLDRVGPVDNRPSPDKLHHFVKKKKLHMTPDT